MVKRLPIIPTIIVLAAVATMIALGVWQLKRAAWKEGLLSRLEANQDRPVMAYPVALTDSEAILFRRAAGFCMEPSIRVTAGRNMKGESGWSHIATCVAGKGKGPGMTVDVGWSATHRGRGGWSAAPPPPPWRGGPVEGVIVPDTKSLIRLVSTITAPGLEPSQPPGPETISNNHRSYALQWFFFAAAAALIYGLALRQRWIKPAS